MQRKKQAESEKLEAVLAEIRQKQAEKEELQQETQAEAERLERLQAEALQTGQKARERLKKAGEIVQAGENLIDDLKALKSEMTALQRERLDSLEARFGDMVADYEAIHEGYFDMGSLER